MFVFMSLLLLTALLSCSSSKPICSKTRKEIAERTGLNPNGDFPKMLKELVGSDGMQIDLLILDDLLYI